MCASIVPKKKFDDTFGRLVELSSVTLGGTIHSVSDEFFASASNLLKVNPPINYQGELIPSGFRMDGWESRRHNPTHDWCIIKLGASSSVVGLDIDTTHFSGNEAPAASVFGAYIIDPETLLTHDSDRWFELLPITPLDPSSQHLLLLPTPSTPVTHLKLNMHPDGGIARFRAYGNIIPAPTNFGDSTRAIDLASVLNGGTIVGTSDAHYGKASYLLMPGRGLDMEDGWQTKRSRGRLFTGEGDWCTIKLGEPGYLEWVDIDTKDFIGNYPVSVQLYGINSSEINPSYDAPWFLILPHQKTSAHQHHYYQSLNPEIPFTHVRLNIYPDGGLKRLRIYGRKAAQSPDFNSLTPLVLSDVTEN